MIKLKQPGGLGKTTGGVPIIARSAVSNGVAAVFIETHDNPDNAPSDGPNMMRLDEMYDLLKILKEIDNIAKKYPIKI